MAFLDYRFNYPVGVTDRDFMDDVMYECECCGADIVRHEPYIAYCEERYCIRCACEAHPEEGDRCEVCGATDSKLFEVDGELICAEHLDFETAGEEW